ncbi:PfkB family carbohydrate kinase [Lentisphaera profundi]|uniref:PfkB family carbohydrate kinase n=1 Tax=Lentisphaera profundi TaxID=1658616 RepID=A0ABY7VRL8_9BACT|nr:PfkB family carbohydrate kinase [Lentisphaera profundi]WDE95875.1 PfkB family carbohydrate kinase [Lentisphaera profundi]
MEEVKRADQTHQSSSKKIVIPACDLLGIGLSVLDHSLFLKSHPQSDEKTTALNSFETIGGPACVGTLCANRLGLRTALISAIGQDSAADFICSYQDKFTNHNFIPLRSDKSAHATILVKDNGERSVIASLPQKVQSSHYHVQHVPKYILLDGRYIDECYDLIMLLKDRGSQIILDAGSANPGILKMLPHAHILISSQKFALDYTKKTCANEALSEIKKTHTQIIITTGEKGSLYYLDGQTGAIIANKIKAVNSNGAGDIFHGAFIAALAGEKNSLESAKIASQIAGWHCTQSSVEQTLQCLGKNLSLESFL